MKRLLGGMAAFAGLAVLVWFVAVPEAFLADRIAGLLSGPLVTTETAGIRKGLFSLAFSEIRLFHADGTPLVALQQARISPDWQALARLRFRLRFHAALPPGILEGSVGLQGGTAALRMEGKGLPLAQVGQPEAWGLRLSGRLSGLYEGNRDEGLLRFTVEDAAIRASHPLLQGLPWHRLRLVRGLLAFRPGGMDLRSLTCEGEGIYGKIRGTVAGKRFDGTLEVTADRTVDLGALPEAMLQPYRASPGRWVIPLRGSLSAS